jgi:hypothetical protein
MSSDDFQPMPDEDSYTEPAKRKLKRRPPADPEPDVETPAAASVTVQHSYHGPISLLRGQVLLPVKQSIKVDGQVWEKCMQHPLVQRLVEEGVIQVS